RWWRTSPPPAGFKGGLARIIHGQWGTRCSDAFKYLGRRHCNCVAPLSPVFPKKSAVSSSTRGRFWAYEAVNPRFPPEKQGLDALNNYTPSAAPAARPRSTDRPTGRPSGTGWRGSAAQGRAGETPRDRERCRGEHFPTTTLRCQS